MLSITLFIRFFFSHNMIITFSLWYIFSRLSISRLSYYHQINFCSITPELKRYQNIFSEVDKSFVFLFFPSVIPKLRPWAVTRVTSAKERLQIFIVSFANGGYDKKLGYCGRNIYKPGLRPWILLQYRGRTDIYRQNLLATEDNPGKNLKTRVLESGRLRVGVT